MEISTNLCNLWIKILHRCFYAKIYQRDGENMNVIKNSTFYIALLLGLVGIILYIVEIFYPIIPFLGLIGFILLVVAWLLFILAVRTTGL